MQPYVWLTLFFSFFLPFIHASETSSTITDLSQIDPDCNEFVLYFTRCTRPLDVIFLLDSSTSLLEAVGGISVEDYRIYIEWLANSIDALLPTGTRLGVAQFSTIMQIEFDLGTYDTFEEMSAAILQFNHMSGLTQTEDAIREAREVMWPKTLNSRNKLLVIVTDGRPSAGQDPCREITLVEEEYNVDTVLIGVGEEVANNIDTFCADPVALEKLKENMVLVGNFSSLVIMEEQIQDLICPAGTVFDGYYTISSSDSSYTATTNQTREVVNGKPTYVSQNLDPGVFVYFDGTNWVFESLLGNSNATVIGYINDTDNSNLDQYMWPTHVEDWHYVDANGDIYVYSGGELAEGKTDCTVVDVVVSYFVDGTVAGLPSDQSVVLTMDLNAEQRLNLTSNGEFQFDAPLPVSTVYNVTVAQQPEGYTCYVQFGNGVIVGEVEDVNVQCFPNSFTVGGTVTGVSDGSLQIVVSNTGDRAEILAIAGDSTTWAFTSLHAFAARYNTEILSTSPGLACDVNAGVGTVLMRNVDNIQIVCTTDVYDISGSIVGLPGGTDIDISVSTTTNTFSTNTFQFVGIVGLNKAYEVTVVDPPGYDCVVTNGAGVAVSHVTGVLVTCALEPYDVGGAVTPPPSAITVSNGADSVTVLASDTEFNIEETVTYGEAYDVVVTDVQDGYTCTVGRGSGTATQDVTDVVVLCGINRYDVSGTVTGLVGNVTISNGASAVVSGASWVLQRTVEHGATYDVQIADVPEGYTCAVSRGLGTAFGHVSNVEIVCSIITYDLAGTIVNFPPGESMTISGGQASTSNILESQGSARFVMPGALSHGEAYDVAIAAQPAGAACSVTAGETGVAVADVTDVLITCTTNVYDISGFVIGMEGTMTVGNGPDTAAVSASSPIWTLADTVEHAGSYAVEVVSNPPGYSCAVTTSNGQGVALSNVANVVIQCNTILYSIGGDSNTVVLPGLSDGVVELSLNGGAPLSVPGGTQTFTFPETLIYGDPYTVTVEEHPPGQSCSLRNAAGTVQGNVDNVQVVCSLSPYTISGIIDGFTGTEFSSGLEMTVLNSVTGEAITLPEGSTEFSFEQTMSFGSAYVTAISQQPLGYTCAMNDRSAGLLTGHVDDIIVTCTENLQDLTGTTSSHVIAGLTTGEIVVEYGGALQTVPGGASSFFFSDVLSYNESYRLTIAQEPPGQTCAVENGEGVARESTVDDIRITCTLNDGFTVGGAVIGLGQGQTVTLTTGSSTVTSPSGTFAFGEAFEFGSAYDVVIANQPSGVNCSVLQGAGQVIGNVNNIAIVCATIEVTVGGDSNTIVIDGLTNGNITVSLNGAETVTVAGGSNGFVFNTPLTYGQTYFVTIAEHPPGQQCTVVNGLGVVTEVDVTNVVINCVELQYTVSGQSQTVVLDGLTDGSLQVALNGGTPVTVAGGSSGFSFPDTLVYGDAFAVSVAAEPLGQDCAVTASASGVVTGNVDTVFIQCTPEQYTLSGTVTGFVGTQSRTVTITNTENSNAAVVNEGASGFQFSQVVSFGDPYAVTVTTQPDGFTCAADAQTASGTATGDVDNIRISCSENVYTITAFVVGLDPTTYLTEASGTAVNDVEGREQESFDMSTSTITFSDGINHGDAYDIQIGAQPTGFSCEVSGNSGQGTIAGNIGNVVIVCLPSLVSVGGVAASTVIEGLTDGLVTIELNGGSPMVVGGNAGPPTWQYVEALSYNQPFDIRVVSEPVGQNCDVGFGTGIALDVDINSVIVVCSLERYPISGTVTGLEAPDTVTLVMGGRQVKSSGSFIFPDNVEFGQNYIVTIQETPTDYTCLISKNSGVVTAPVTDVTVVCQAIPTASPSTTPSVPPSTTPTGNPTTTVPSVEPTVAPNTPGPSVTPSEAPIDTPRPSKSPSTTPTHSYCDPYDVFFDTRVDFDYSNYRSLGQNFEVYSTVSYTECGNTCRDFFDRCDGFEYHKELQRCLIFQTGQVGVVDDVQFEPHVSGYVSGLVLCDEERAWHCEVSSGNISLTDPPIFYVHESGISPEDPNNLRFLVEVHPSFFNNYLGFDNATNCGSNYTLRLEYPYEDNCQTTRWRYVGRVNDSTSICDPELYQLDVPFWNFVVGEEGGAEILEACKLEDGTILDDPNFYYIGFVMQHDAQQPFTQREGDRFWQDVRDALFQWPGCIQLERTVEVTTTIIVYTEDYTYATVGAVVEHISVVNNYGYQTPYGSSTFEVRTRSQFPYRFEESGMTIIQNAESAKVQEGVVQTATPTIDYVREEGSCTWYEGDPYSDVCDQIWTITVEPDFCYIDGDYTVVYPVTCFRNKTCSVPEGSSDRISMTFRLESTNFCPEMVQQVGVQGEIIFTGVENYDAEAEHHVIFLDDTVHYRTYVWSPEAVIVHAQLLNFHTTFLNAVTGATDHVVIWRYDDTGTDLGLIPYYPSEFSSVEYIDVMPLDSEHIVQISATEIGFSFVVDRRIFPLPVDVSSSLVVTCEIEVTFEGEVGYRRQLFSTRRRMQVGQTTNAGAMDVKLRHPPQTVLRPNVYLHYNDSYSNLGNVHFFMQIRVQKDRMAKMRLDAGKLLHIIRSVLAEFSQSDLDVLLLNRVDACTAYIMKDETKNWNECDTLFADRSLLGTPTDYMPLQRTGLHYIDKNVLQVWGTFLKSETANPMIHWNHLYNALHNPDSAFYGTSLFHSSTLIEASARDAPVSEEDSSSARALSILIPLLLTFIQLLS